jgi:hypothetical protein
MPVGDTQVVKVGSKSTMQLKKREAQDRVLALLAQGLTIAVAMAQVDRTRAAYHKWCREEDWFKDRANAIRHREPEEKEHAFVDFRLVYFGFETPWHQQQIIDLIEAADEGSINMILLPPGAGKTTVLEDYYNFKLAHEPNHRFCVISESQFHARKILGHVANRMVDRSLYPAYIDNFGPFKAEGRDLQKPWGANAISHAQANSGERDYSIEAKGAGTAIYGGSFDDIILDDIQSEAKVGRTEGLMEYFQNTLYSRVMRANTKGRIFIVGTRQGQGDFYEEILKLDIVANLVKIPALDEYGHSYYPPRKVPDGRIMGYSEAELEQTRRVVGEDAWARQHMQEPAGKRGQTFTPSMIEKCLDEKRGITSGSDPMAPGVYRIAALDPALAGHSVFRVAGFDYQRLYLLDGKNEEGLSRFEDMWDIIEELTIKWHPQVWIIEGNAIQGGIARSDRIKALSEKYGFTIVSHQTGRNKQDDVIGVASMAGTFLRGEISIPQGDDEARQSFAPLISELKAWRADVPTRFLRQDEVMCLWFIHLHWQRMRAQLASRIDRRVHTQGLPWKPSGYRAKVSA